MDNPSQERIGTVAPNIYRSKYMNKISFSMSIFNQLNECLKYGTISTNDKEHLRRFERAVKMLEAFLINYMTEEHKGLIKKTIAKSMEAVKKDDRNDYYESIRLRFMYNMRILNKVQDLIPEEKAIEYIGMEEEKEPIEVVNE